MYVFERADAFGTTFLSGLLRSFCIADLYGARAERHVVFVAAIDFQCVVDLLSISDTSACRVFGGTVRSSARKLGRCDNPSQIWRLFFVIDALSRWPVVCWFSVSDIRTNNEPN